MKRLTLGVYGSTKRKRVLIVNCYFDDTRQIVHRTRKTPQSMAPVYLAGAFSKELCEVRLYNEVYSGPLHDEHLLSWPDMLVLSGLTTAFDRMLHLTAYARTMNPRVIVVAGGPAIRALPQYSSLFFDYCCVGDIEQMKDIITDSFGRSHILHEMIPRFDLAYWIGKIGHIETTRNCNFRCPFCTLTGEGGKYQKYEIENIRNQILAMGKKFHLNFLDNNFYGNDRNYYLARIELLKDMKEAGYFKHWSALVTNDFFLNEENINLARESGCIGLFSGVESFDGEWLQNNKKQNTHLPQIELIQKCLNSGIVFLYGVILDFTTRRVEDLAREVRFITGTPEITLPSFFSTIIPILGTPLFKQYLTNGDILPNTKIRDLDGTTLALRPIDSRERVSEFIREVQRIQGYRMRSLLHGINFYRRYRSKLTPLQMVAALSNALLLSSNAFLTASIFKRGIKRTENRTHISTSEGLESVYTPAFRVASQFEEHFKPTMVTDDQGHLTKALEVDLIEAPDKERAAVVI